MSQRKVYIIENLGCANCAAKMERKINELLEVEEATITFATKQLRVVAEKPDVLLSKFQEICASIESEVVVVEKDAKAHSSKRRHEVHDHDEEGECCCGHDHDHEVHHHQEEGECCCGHDHDHDHHHEAHDHHEEGECCCGHDHEHDHHHEAHHHHEEGECCCGHDHDHHHEAHHHHEEDECCCGHDHDHHHDHEHHHHDATAKVYILENLGCANCAAKMERKINELPEVEEATIIFATKQLRVTAEHPEELLPKLQEICASIESEVVVVEKVEKIRMSKDGHEHKEPAQAPKKKEKKSYKDEYLIGAGIGMFVCALIWEHMVGQIVPSTIILILDYILLGAAVLKKAVKNITKGNVFDENFLMSIATLAALCIGDFSEAVGVMLFYRIGEFFEDIAVSKSRSQIMEAVDLRPETVVIEENGKQVEIPAEEAYVGDIIIVRPGDRIPLDGVVVEGRSQIDTSAVTGEPVPVAVAEGDSIFSGCVNEQGLLKLRVEKELSESMVTRILDSVENAAASKPQIDRFITRFARIYTPVVVAIAILTAIIPSVISGNWHHWIYTAVTFLVISCPCALVLSVPLAFFSGIGAGSKLGILFKGGVAIEALAKIKAVVMDKTGTITKGEFKVRNIVATGMLTKRQILTLAADIEQYSTHPIAKSILAEANANGLQLVEAKGVEEISGKGIRALFVEGEALCGNSGLMNLYGIDISAFERAVSGTEVFVALNGKIEGLIQIDDVIKEDAGRAIRRMKGKRLITAILTGDAPANAMAVAKTLNIDEVHAKLLPQEKLSRLEMIRNRHGAVMFVGDGINDAPVLANADVGAAMGSGADAAIEAADVVFMNSSMESIPIAIDIAKKTNKIAIENVVFALVIKALVMVLGLTGHANMWMAVFADTGVAIICIINSIRALYHRYN